MYLRHVIYSHEFEIMRIVASDVDLIALQKCNAKEDDSMCALHNATERLVDFIILTNPLVFTTAFGYRNIAISNVMKLRKVVMSVLKTVLRQKDIKNLIFESRTKDFTDGSESVLLESISLTIKDFLEYIDNLRTEGTDIYSINAGVNNKLTGESIKLEDISFDRGFDDYIFELYIKFEDESELNLPNIEQSFTWN